MPGLMRLKLTFAFYSAIINFDKRLGCSMLAALDMPQALKITLKYDGPSVDDGTMPVEDVVNALQGFAGAYGKIATRIDPQRDHQLRVAAIATGSFELLIGAWIVTQAAAAGIESLKPVVDAARWVYSTLKGIISIKKHTKGRPYDISVRGEGNTVIVFNSDGTQLNATPEVFESFKSSLVDSDLNKIASPLSPERVESVKISSEDDPEPVIITAGDRDAFVRRWKAS
jgi:hypothetical protein